MIITSNGTWFLKGTEVKPLYLSDSSMLVVGIVEQNKLDEELCSIEEFLIDGIPTKEIEEEELYVLIDEYNKSKRTEEDMKNYIKNKYGILDES